MIIHLTGGGPADGREIDCPLADPGPGVEWHEPSADPARIHWYCETERTAEAIMLEYSGLWPRDYVGGPRRGWKAIKAAILRRAGL